MPLTGVRTACGESSYDALAHNENKRSRKKEDKLTVDCFFYDSRRYSR